MSSPAQVDPTESKLRDLFLQEFKENETTAKWLAKAKKGIVISFTQFSLTPKMKLDTNALGREYGCHSCDARLEIDPDQPWVGDHFPPTELAVHARAALDKVFEGKSVNVKTQVLMPQCNDCSNRQASLVRRLNTMTSSEICDSLSKDEEEAYHVLLMIQGPEVPKLHVNCTGSSGPKVTETEGYTIQQLGIKNGCHSDPSHRVPATTYHADHIWPQELCTNYMEQVLKLLNLLEYKPKEQELRPQCPRCSGHQGGKLKQIATLAQQFAKENKVTFYK